MTTSFQLNPAFRPGSWVVAMGEVWRVIETNLDNSVRLERPGKEPVSIPASSLKGFQGTTNIDPRLKAFTEYPVIKQKIALERRDQIRHCLSEGWTIESITKLSDQMKKSVRTTMRLVDQFILSGEKLQLLIPGVFRFEVAHRKVSPEVLAVIKEGLDTMWFTEERAPEVCLLEWIETKCNSLELPKPARSTVRRHRDRTPEKKGVTTREGLKAVREKFRPLAEFAPTGRRPFDVVQIDHSPINVLIVLPSGKTARAWITIAIDLYTRMIVGLHIGVEAPSRLLVGMCLYRMMTDKEPWLREHGIYARWDCKGVAEVLHSDSAKEFESMDIEDIAFDQDSNLEKRPAGQADFGGIVERWMGKAALVAEILPGKTFRNIANKKDYKPEKWASLTLPKLEKYFLHYIAEEYHNKPHRGLRGRSPMNVWDDWLAGRAPDDQFPRQAKQASTELLFSLLPSFERTIQQGGVTSKGKVYFDHCMDAWIKRKNPKTRSGMHRFHFDVRRAKTVYWQDPDTSLWHTILTKDLGTPDLPEWELDDLLEADRKCAKDRPDYAQMHKGRAARFDIRHEARTTALKNQKEKKAEKRRRTQQSLKQASRLSQTERIQQSLAIASEDASDAAISSNQNRASQNQRPTWECDYLDFN